MLKIIKNLFTLSKPNSAGYETLGDFGKAPEVICAEGVEPFLFKQLLNLERGFPDPDWPAFGAWLELLDSEELRARAWGEAEVAWLQHLRDFLGASYRLARRDDVLILSALPDRRLNATFDFCGRTAKSILRVLDGIAQFPSFGYEICIVFHDQDTYYRYVAPWYEKDDEFDQTSAMHLQDGCSYFVSNSYEQHLLEPIIAHQMTSSSLAHLQLPTWLNTGISLNTERHLGSSVFQLSQEQAMYGKHLSFWGAAEIQEFWSGDSFVRADEGSALAFDLAQRLVAYLSADAAGFKAFVNNADCADAGEQSAWEHLGVRLGAAVQALLAGEADLRWEPNPAAWPSASEPDAAEV